MRPDNWPSRLSFRDALAKIRRGYKFHESAHVEHGQVDVQSRPADSHVH